MSDQIPMKDISELSQFAFPRTGKRGVPQQFPRRLYEMLEQETKLAQSDAHHRVVIAWSSSGKAFRIIDVTHFADVILPRYFRTKKFSSFQRNLNLYGFTKARKGPETDMYAHPSFLRDEPKLLLNLRKLTTTTRRRLSSDASSTTNTTTSMRSFSPTSSPPRSPNRSSLSSEPFPPVPTSVTLKLPQIPQGHHDDRGKLDLLAMAMELEFALCR